VLRSMVGKMRTQLLIPQERPKQLPLVQEG